MDKELLMKKIDEKVLKGCPPQQKEQAGALFNDLKQKLDCFRDDFDFSILPSVKKYVDTEIPVSNSPVTILSEINLDLVKLIKEDTKTVEKNARNALDNRKKVGMWIFLSVIIVLAVVALICAILEIVYVNSEEERKKLEIIVTVFGLLDFALGACGFVWERISDMKNETKKAVLHEVTEKTINAKNSEELVEAKHEYEAFISNSFNKAKVNGDIYIGTSIYIKDSFDGAKVKGNVYIKDNKR